MCGKVLILSELACTGRGLDSLVIFGSCSLDVDCLRVSAAGLIGLHWRILYVRVYVKIRRKRVEISHKTVVDAAQIRPLCARKFGTQPTQNIFLRGVFCAPNKGSTCIGANIKPK